MRDQHRPKQDLINEVIGLRKQVADLREAMTARRRVEDALRESERQTRMLADAAPVGLCLFRADGTAFAANRPFARLLGYETTAELLGLGGTLGVFASREEQSRVLALVEGGPERACWMAFRRKDGTRQAFGVVGAFSMETGAVALAVLGSPPQVGWGAWLAALGAARPAGTGGGDRGMVRGAGREPP